MDDCFDCTGITPGLHRDYTGITPGLHRDYTGITPETLLGSRPENQRLDLVFPSKWMNPFIFNSLKRV